MVWALMGLMLLRAQLLQISWDRRASHAGLGGGGGGLLDISCKDRGGDGGDGRAFHAGPREGRVEILITAVLLVLLRLRVRALAQGRLGQRAAGELLLRLVLVLLLRLFRWGLVAWVNGGVAQVSHDWGVEDLGTLQLLLLGAGAGG